MSYYDYPASIEAAAKILDEAIPDWFRKIDLHKLKMDDTDSCILGQLYGGNTESFSNGLNALFGPKCCRWDRQEDYVFGYRAHISVWKAEILQRRNPVVVPVTPPTPRIVAADVKYFLKKGNIVAAEMLLDIMTSEGN